MIHFCNTFDNNNRSVSWKRATVCRHILENCTSQVHHTMAVMTDVTALSIMIIEDKLNYSVLYYSHCCSITSAAYHLALPYCKG